MARYGNNNYQETLNADFFYKNVFQRESEGKARALQYSVRNNLMPFRDLLNNLLQNNDKLMRVSATVYPVDNVITLEPEFCIARLTLGKETKYNVPTDRYYILEWDEDYGDIEDFIEISDRRRSFVIEKADRIDYFDGYVIFKSSGIFQRSLNLWYGKDEKSVVCDLRELHFECDFGKYRISASKEITGLKCDAGIIIISSVDDEKIVLFDSVEISKSGETQALDPSKLTADVGKRIRFLENGYCIVYSDEVRKIFYDGEAVQFTKVSEREYSKLLNDKNIVIKGNALGLADSESASDGIYSSTYGTSFICKSGQFNVSPRHRDGVFVMLEDDGSYDSEIQTSTSFFFREDIEKLTDVERSRNNQYGGREFKIGRKLEDESIIEIVEVVGGKLQKVTELPKKLYIVSNPYQLRMQMNAVNILINEPAVHHKPILQLMDDRFYWGAVDLSACHIDEWYRLYDDNYDGVEEQRRLVKLALCTNDFAFLEGPPGSGKTTTILEIIAQMIMRGERVMLAASTNAAIDNILERLEKLPEKIRKKILAVRIGNDGSVCETVDHYRPDNCADIKKDDNLCKVILERANLVCGTTFGVLKHPEFNLSSQRKGSCIMIPPLFDCLIVDEASKTTFQDFLVPAIFAKKWILSGDINQLTPYIEKEDIASSIRYMDGFNEKLQDVQGIIQQLSTDNHLGKLRFCIPIGQQYISAITKLAPKDEAYLCIADKSDGICVSIENLLNGGDDAYKLYGAKYIFIRDDYFERIESILPSDIIVLRKSESDAFTSYFANAHYFENKRINGVKIRGGWGQSEYSNVDEIRKVLTQLIQSKDWAGEIAWRVARQQELFMLSRVDKGNGDKVIKLNDDISDRIPTEYQGKISNFLNLLRELSLPSILQLLKQGTQFANDKHRTTLNSGFEQKDYDSRSILLQYQGRMHSDIATFSRECLYNNEALIDSRILDREWQYGAGSRNWWIDVEHPTKDCNSENDREIRRIIEEIEKFAVYAATNPKRQDPEDGGCWSIAVLTYYKKQEANIKKAIAKLTGSKNSNKSVYRWEGKNIKIEVYSVDKYQGKEADVVFLSMVKSGRVGLGFMDSPNRLNVALTRAKFLRVIVGNRKYFKSARNYLLKKLEGSV